MPNGESSFRSPVSKLLRFFHSSRDKWKAKHHEAKRENKSLKYRLKKMTEKRDRWKAEALRLRQDSDAEAAAECGAKSAAPSRGCRPGRRAARAGGAGAG